MAEGAESEGDPQNARGYRAGHAEEEKERAIGLRVILPTSQKNILALTQSS